MFDYRDVSCSSFMSAFLEKASKGFLFSFSQIVLYFQASLFLLRLEAFFLALFLRVKNVFIFFSDACKKIRFFEKDLLLLLTMIVALKGSVLDGAEKKLQKDFLFFRFDFCPTLFSWLKPMHFLREWLVLGVRISIFREKFFLRKLSALSDLKTLAKASFLFFDVFLSFFKELQERFSFSRWKQEKYPMITLLS